MRDFIVDSVVRRPGRSTTTTPQRRNLIAAFDTLEESQGEPGTSRSTPHPSAFDIPSFVSATFISLLRLRRNWPTTHGQHHCYPRPASIGGGTATAHWSCPRMTLHWSCQTKSCRIRLTRQIRRNIRKKRKH